MKLLLLASAGGAMGAGARFIVNQALGVPAVAGGTISFPWATLTVNVAGGFLMGVVFVLVGERLGGSQEWRVFLATGILGGFTTFSAYSLDMLLLYASDGLSARLLCYVAGSVVLSFLALLFGLWLSRVLFT